MSLSELDSALKDLTELQRQIVDWGDGPLFVLAGPGSGKTRVLTTRVARLLNDSPKESFRILALTFTNKAADEMLARVVDLVPEMERRIMIGTFHSFCMQLLQQHGSHIGIQPDFNIYSQDSDRREILKEAIQSCGVRGDASAYLGTIDKLKSSLVEPNGCSSRFRDQEQGRTIELVYHSYEAVLLKSNAMDFGSLIANCYKLVTSFPGIATQVRRAYRYWLFDEFQDTNDGQYRLIKQLAGESFRNIFAVADDDQIIYQWNGASFQQMQRFRNDFAPNETQLPTNYRCPPTIVELANNLVSHNQNRTLGKKQLVAGKTNLAYPVEEHLSVLKFASAEEEADGIAVAVGKQGKQSWGKIAVLARSRSILDTVQSALKRHDIDSAIAQRRDDFISPAFQWLNAILKLLLRPLDKITLETAVGTFNRWFDARIVVDEIVTCAELSSRSYLEEWCAAVLQHGDRGGLSLVNLLVEVSFNRTRFRDLIQEFLRLGDSLGENGDFIEDLAAWDDIYRNINRSIGPDAKLEQFLQELSMRSKEPPSKPNTVTLMTIHASKGKEFDHVFLVGLAEEVLPSYQSVKSGENSSEMEEERRNCFVAITRCRERLFLTFAETYRGYRKAPSRFLGEMGVDIPAAYQG